MNDKPPLLEMLELAKTEMDRINARQKPQMSVEELAELLWWAFRLSEMKQRGTATRH